MSAAQSIQALISAMPDPEIPVLTLEDLGIVRAVEQTSDRRVVVTLTPTYSGCPALDQIRIDVERAVRDAGFDDVEVRMQLAPAWSSDWISDRGRRKLRAYGIAPPAKREGVSCAVLARAPRCPRCDSEDTREVSHFGSTPCQSQHVCNSCLEPFDRFKSI